MADTQVPDFLREFDDAKAARRNIYSNTLEAMKKRFPMEDDNYRLELNDLEYDGPQEYSLAEQKKALLNNRNLRTNLVGTWRLVDKKTGNVLDERRQSVMQVPYWTDRGTIINNGSEYTVISQSRLRPGVYARRKSNGEFEAQFNIRPGTGRAFHIGLQPETGMMTLQTGQGSVPLYQILKGFGVDDKKIVKYWGADVALANSQKVDSQAWNKLYRRMAGYKAIPNATEADKIQFIKDAVGAYEVDPEVVERTMGLRNVSTVTPELLLRASQKVLNVSRGDEKPDNRDNPRFSKFYGVEDYFKERVEKNAGRLANTLLWKARRAGNLKGIQRNALNPWVDTIINGSGLAMPGEEANPLSTLEQMSRISKFGLGGIGSKDAVTDEARNVQGDYLGFVDFVAGPECFVPGSFIMAKSGYIPVENVTEDTEIACLVNDRLEYHKPVKVIAEQYLGDVFSASTKFIQYKVTGNHRVLFRTAYNPVYRFKTAAEIHGHIVTLKTGGHAPYVSNSAITEFIVPHVDKFSNHTVPDLPAIDIETWASFMGWFLSEGNVNGRNIRITQSKPDYLNELTSVLKKLPVSFTRQSDDFVCSSLQLSSYLSQFGHSWEKYIPEYFFEATVDARKALLEALCYGDGRRKRDTYTYCTISERLAKDVERLCFSLGISANVRFERDTRHIARRTGGIWAVHINKKQERELCGGNVWRANNYSKEFYSGTVYCVTVPGGTVYARYGDRGAHWTGNSEAIGVDTRASYRSFLGRDNKIYGEFIDNQTGKKAYVDIATAADRMVAFPGQDPKSPYLIAIKDGVPQRVPRDEVRYTVPSYGHMVGSNTNMNPMPTGVQVGRQFYGSKFWSQYLPQAKGEVPLVDTLMPDGKLTWREYYGRKVGSIGAEADGVVTKVTDDEITIKGNDGKVYKQELVKNLPFNRLSALSYLPAVEVGQAVKAGDMVAHSNFTDKKTGSINMGQNLYVAVLPDGRSFEDGWSISESAAKRLATDRLYSFDHETRNGVTIGKNKYISAFPSKFTKEQVETLDENGVVKVGTTLHRGDPLVLSLGPKILSSQDKALGKLSKALRNSYVDRSETWEHDYPGKVVDTAVTSKGAKVNVSAQPPVREGDKISPMAGIKGVVAEVIPDDKMPRNAATNQPYDVLMNPMGFLSRVAPNQLIELSLGKVAKATGKQIRIPQLPPPEGWYRWAKAQMDAAGVKDASDVFDPVSGRVIKNIGDGYMYTMAFHHLAEKKASAVGTDGSYTQDEQPAKGGFEGAKKMCFVALQSIRTLHGEENIGHIVEKRVRELVWTRFDDGSWGYAPIINWFMRKGKMSDVLSIQVNHLPTIATDPRKSVKYGSKNLFVTKNHEIYTLSGKTCAGALKPGDFVATYGYVPTNDQISLIYGSMLGDAAICDIDNDSGLFYLDQHSQKQLNYVHWKIEQLGTIAVARSITAKKSKCGYKGGAERTALYRISRHDITIPLRNIFYRVGGKTVKKTVKNLDLDSLSDVAIVAWFLDDGCVSFRTHGGLSCNIATMGFSENDVDILAAWLSKRIGVSCHRGKYNDIRIPTEGAEALARMCAKYVKPRDIPSTKKWLIQKVTEYADLFVGVDTNYQLGTVGALVTSVAPYSDGKHGPDDEICLYDITVDRSHKYCAADVLVSNSGMDLWGMLAHNVPEVIKDAQITRGTKNDQYWRALQLGLPIPEPEEPFIYKKFLNTLRAGGINVTEKGAITKIMPQTDKDIDQLAQGRVITSSDMVDPDFEPMKGGLFDLGKTGGMGGNQWSMIQLPEPVPNPIMEEPVRRVLGLTVAKMEDILAGREKLDGKTGGQALKDALAAVNVDQKLAEAKKGITSLRGQKRDDAVKIYRYLSAMKEQGLKPQDWMVSKVPVLPPAFRPVSKMGDVALVSDMNELYKDILENAKNFEELRKDVSDDGLADERLDIYNSVKAAYGLGEPITPENAAKGVKGALKQVIGSRPKFGQFQSKVISKTVNGVARGVTVADPNYDMDEIGMPEDMAWPVYKPYVMRALVRNGYPTVAAIKMIADRTPTARHLLEEEMSKRPVIMDRAPTWHKFNFMAFKPRLVDGHKIVVSPLVDPAYNMDHDGNCVDFNSLVVVRLAKSMLDKMEEICDNGVSQNQKEYSMTNANTSVRIVKPNKVEAVVKIGTFPRVGTPTLDKNGAYIYEVPEGIEVLSTDPVTGERRFEPVTKFTHEYDCETVKVSYGSKSVIVSGNESLAVFDQKEGQLVRVKPDEAEKRFTPVFVSSSDRFGSFGNRDLGWLFGSYISDGWSDYRMVGYTKVEKIKRDEFVRILRDNHQNFNLYEYTDSKGDKKLGNSVKIHCNSQSVSRWLNQWQFVHEDRDEANGARTALYKMIDPRLIESGSEEFLWGLMSGLLDGDGSIVCNTAKAKPRYTFRLNTSSPYLRDGLCRLCHKLGLRYSVTVVPARGWSKESYVVSPSTVDMFTKLDRLTCIGESEKKVLAALKAVQKRPTDNADMVPVSDVEFDIIKTCPLLVSGGSLYNTLHRTAKEGARRAGREHLKGILSYLQEHDETKALAARVLATNTKWVQITSVEPAGKREVFDLEVATTKTFVVNDGITVWDTVNLHVPSSYKAVQQALSKMLPSENLTSLTDLSSPRYTPGKEQIFGLYALTKGMDMSKPVKVFNSVSEAKQAYARGEIGPNDPIEIRR